MTNGSNKKWYQKRKYKILMIIVTALIIFRILLPEIVKRYVNEKLANVPGYYGQVEDIDIALYRGAYVIKGLYLNKLTAASEVPFLNFPETDISIEWKSIFKGRIVSEVYMINPEVIYVAEDWVEESEEEADIEDWTDLITDIVPININHYELINGKVAYVETTAKPDIDLQVNSLYATIDNIRNVRKTGEKLPSPIMAEGTSIGNGQLSLDGELDLIKVIPDMDLNFSIENIDLTALNDFSSHYANIDFESGNIGLYSELAIADSYMDGYFKTLVKESKLIGKDEQFLEKIWEGFVAFFKFILKNKDTKNFGVKAPIEGNLDNPEADVLPTILSIFKNAFIKAFESEVDGEIEFVDALKAKNSEKEEEERKWWQFWKKNKDKDAE